MITHCFIRLRTCSSATLKVLRVRSLKAHSDYFAKSDRFFLSKCTVRKIAGRSFKNSPNSDIPAAISTRITFLRSPDDSPAHCTARPQGSPHRRRRGILPLSRHSFAGAQFSIGNSPRALGYVRLAKLARGASTHGRRVARQLGSRAVYRARLVLTRLSREISPRPLHAHQGWRTRCHRFSRRRAIPRRAFRGPLSSFRPGPHHAQRAPSRRPLCLYRPARKSFVAPGFIHKCILHSSRPRPSHH